MARRLHVLSWCFDVGACFISLGARGETKREEAAAAAAEKRESRATRGRALKAGDSLQGVVDDGGEEHLRREANQADTAVCGGFFGGGEKGGDELDEKKTAKARARAAAAAALSAARPRAEVQGGSAATPLPEPA